VRQFLAGHHLRHADAQAPARLGLAGACAVIGGLQAIQQGHGVAVIIAPGLGQRQAPAVAVEQAHLQVFFQLPQLPRHRRMGGAQALGGGGETARFDDGAQRAQGGEVIHRRQLPEAEPAICGPRQLIKRRRRPCAPAAPASPRC